MMTIAATTRWMVMMTVMIAVIQEEKKCERKTSEVSVSSRIHMEGVKVNRK